MMKRQIRILFGVMAVTLAVMMAMTGCTTSAPAATSAAAATSAPAETATPTVAPTPSAAPTLAPVKLVWYIPGNGDEPDKDAVLKAVNDYLQPKINASIDLRTIAWGSYDTTVNPLLSSGDSSVDIVFTASWAANYVQNSSSGYFTDLTDLLSKYGQDIVKACGTDFLGGCKIGGKQFAIPCNKEQAHTWGPLLLKSLVTKYNVDVSTLHTWADLVPVFDKIKAGETDVWPLCVVQGESPFMSLDWDHMSDDNTPGALDPTTEATTPTVVDNLVDAKSVTMYNMMRDWYKKGYINPDAATQTDYNALISTGKYFAIDQSLKPNKYVEMSGSTKQDWVQVAFSPAVMSNRETLGSLTALPTAGKNQDRAMMFLNMLYSDTSLLNMLDYGIKDVNYTVVSGNIIDPSKGTNNSGAKPGYAPGNTWKFGNQFMEFTTAADSPDVWQQYQDFNKGATVLASLGFVFDASKVSNEIAACKTVFAKYMNNLETGAGTDPVATEVANYTKELNDAGVATLIAEEQAQYTAFLASKK